MISFNTTDDSRDLGQFSTSKDLPRYGRTTRPSGDDTTRRAEQELGLLVSHLPGATPSPPGEDSRPDTTGELQVSSRPRSDSDTTHGNPGCPAADGSSRLLFLVHEAGWPDMASAGRSPPLFGIRLLRLQPLLVARATPQETTVSQLACAALTAAGCMTEATRCSVQRRADAVLDAQPTGRGAWRGENATSELRTIFVCLTHGCRA